MYPPVEENNNNPLTTGLTNAEIGIISGLSILFAIICLTWLICNFYVNFKLRNQNLDK
jgi:hypothetical protein